VSLILLAITNAHALHDLGKISHARYTAAAACARSAFEIGAVAAWLQVPDDPFEREGRWLGWLKANERFYSKLAVDLVPISSELVEAMKNTAAHYLKWMSAIEAKLPHGKIIEKPALANILTELGSSHLYMTYRGVSQIVHGEPDGTRTVYRVDYVFKDPKAKDEIAETVGQRSSWGFFTTESEWDILLKMATWGVMASLSRLVSRVGEQKHLEDLSRKYDAIHSGS
jgi:hypothetical protein